MTYERKPFLLILIAPSGGGKSTICDRILALEKKFVYSISSTTRERRGNEKDGIDYHFLTKKEFKAGQNKGEFIESALVHGNWYGTSRRFIENELQKGNNIILDIDVQGAMKILESGIECVTVFLLPPTQEELSKRLSERGTDSSETIGLRLENARKEIDDIRNFDYLVINDNLEHAVEDVRKIIRAESIKVSRYKEIKKNYYRRQNA